MNLDLKDHVALVVGGASGIGLATARGFAGEGRMLRSGSQRKRGGSCRAVGEEFGVKSLGISVDVTDESALNVAFSQTLDHFCQVDHLVHAAAIGSGRFGFPFTNLNPSDWLRVLHINIMGMTNIAHVITPHMVERASGTMVFIASVAGQMGSQTDPPYSASKAANINFAQCMAKDLAPKGVRVNTVCPGMVQTPLNRSVWQAWHDRADPADGWLMRSGPIARSKPSCRWGCGKRRSRCRHDRVFVIRSRRARDGSDD